MRLRAFERWTPANSMMVAAVLAIALVVSLMNALFVPTLGAWLLVAVVAVLFVVAAVWVRSLLRHGRDVAGTGPAAGTEQAAGTEPVAGTGRPENERTGR